jgi:hypothetical protein
MLLIRTQRHPPKKQHAMVAQPQQRLERKLQHNSKQQRSIGGATGSARLSQPAQIVMTYPTTSYAAAALVAASTAQC